MKLKEMKSTALIYFNKAKYKTIKHAPEIMAVVGGVGAVVGVVLACKATLKVHDILEKTKSDLNDIHEVRNDPKFDGIYTEESAKKDTAIVYARTGIKFVCLYAPSASLLALSIASMIGSTFLQKKRNVALAAALATIDRGFKEYRERVVERYGTEADRRLRYNIRDVEVEETVTDENGEEQIVKKAVEVADIKDPNGYSIYARCFDESNPNWLKDDNYNVMFLKHRQNMFNDKLKANGILFLNEVYEELGFPKTKEGQVIGWIYDPDHPIGDNYVDFGIYNTHRPAVRDFINGYERSVILDFNVDGNVWDYM